MEESPRLIKTPSIHEAIVATTILEKWFCREKPDLGWLHIIAGIRCGLRNFRDNPPKEKQLNEPL